MKDISSLHTNLIKELEERLPNWSKTPKISDILLKFDFGEIYWPYIKYFNLAFLTVIFKMKENPNFEKEFDVKYIFLKLFYV